MGYLIGQLGGLLPIPGGIGGIDGGLIGTLIVYGAPGRRASPPRCSLYRVILFWLPLLLGAVASPRSAGRSRRRRASTCAAHRASRDDRYKFRRNGRYPIPMDG